MKMNEKVNKKRMLKVIILFMLIVAIVVFVGVAFARYITSLNGNASMNTAKWSWSNN